MPISLQDTSGRRFVSGNPHGEHYKAGKETYSKLLVVLGLVPLDAGMSLFMGEVNVAVDDGHEHRE